MSRVFRLPAGGPGPSSPVGTPGVPGGTGADVSPAVHAGREPAAPDVPAVTTRARRGLVASSHALASEAGLRALHDGGTAVDAALAANVVLSVAYPDMCGVGGDLFALVWPPGSSEPVALDAAGPGGSGHVAGRLARAHPRGLPLYGPTSVTVPGAPAGWAALHRRFGRLPFERVFADAVAYAENGIPCPRRLVASLRRWELPPESVTLDGDEPVEGARLRLPSYARTLAAIGRDGPDAFYAGIGGSELEQATEGLITVADLAAYEPRWVDPIARDVFGLRWWTSPPVSQGYVALLAADILQRLDPPDDPDDPRLWHLMIEATKAASHDRDRVLGDTRVAPAALDDAAARAATVSDRAAALPTPAAPGDTVYLAAVDQTGTGVSLIQSLYHPWGSRVRLPHSGVLLQNRGASFSLEPGHPNQMAPGRRPRSTLTPTALGDEQGLTALIGSMGGDVQPHVALQLLVKLRLGGLDPAATLAHPRFFLHRGLAPTIWSGEPPVVGIESRVPASLVRDLERRGHPVRPGPAFAELAGHAQVVTVDGLGYAGAAEPRSGAGGVAAW